MKVEPLDSSVELGLGTKVGSLKAKSIKDRDIFFSRQQEKVLRIMGPLGKLWRELTRIRKSKQPVGKVKLANILEWTEKAVLLVGQANVAVRHTRRVEIIGALMGSISQAKALLKKHDHLLREGELFGKQFHKQVEEDTAKGSSTGILALSKARPDNRPSTSNSVPKFQRNKPFPGGPKRDQAERGGWKKTRGRRIRGKKHPRGQGDRYVLICNTSNTKHKEPSKPRAGKQDPTVLFIRDNSPIPRVKGSKANANENKRKTIRSLAASSRKLGESHKRSKCVKHCRRLSDRVCEKATSFPVSSQSEVFSGRDETADRRGKKAHSKGSYTTGARQARPVSRSPVPPRKERRVIQTDLQPQKTERACEIPTFQDGRVVPSERSATARRLDDQIGSQGCIFLRGNGRQGEKISTLPVAGADVRVPVSPIRAGLSPTRLHQAPETCSGISTENRDQNDLLLGRHAPSQSEHARIASGRQDYLGSSGSSGICDQHRKVNTSAQPSDGIPGHDDRLQGHDVKIISRENTEDTDEVWSDASAGGGISQGTVKIDRDIFVHHSGNPPSKAALQAAADVAHHSADEGEFIREHHQVDCGMQRGDQMVDDASGRSQRQGSDGLSPGHHDRDRCITDRLGGSMAEADASGPLDGGRENRANQCPRAQSSLLSHKSILSEPERPSHSGEGGQHNCCCTHQQDGGDQIPQVSGHCKTVVGVLSAKKPDVDCRVPTRIKECPGRQVVTGLPRFQRLAAGSSSVQVSEQQVAMQSRPVCEQVEQTATTVYQLENRPRCNGSGRILNPVGGDEDIHVSPIQHDQQMSGKNSPRKSRCSVDNTNLAHSAVVRDSSECVGRPSNPSTTIYRPATVTNGSSPPIAGEQVHAPGGMEGFRQQQTAQGLSRDAADLLTSSWRKGTRAAYNSSWSKWYSWCTERATHPVHAPVEMIVEFITDMWKAGYGYNTINGYRSAISSLHAQIDGLPVGQHPLVKRAMTGVFNVRPPMPKYADTWRVDVVLDYINRMGPNAGLGDKALSHKLAMLLALTTASRASEIQGLDLAYMNDRRISIEFTIPTLTKTRRVGGKPTVVVLHEYEPNKILDVVSCTRAYVLRTQAWRVSDKHHKLLLGIIAPHNPVCTSTIANWLKHIMAEAGIDVSTYTGHSTRSASTTKAKSAGLSVADILQKANWSNASTFHRFYDRSEPDRSKQFASLVLHQS